jgi:hypothetical protein
MRDEPVTQAMRRVAPDLQVCATPYSWYQFSSLLSFCRLPIIHDFSIYMSEVLAPLLETLL